MRFSCCRKCEGPPANSDRRTEILRPIIICLIAALWGACGSATFAWQDEAKTPEQILKDDLAKLQGKWAATRRVGNQIVRSVKVIDGNRTTLTRSTGDGEVFWAHTSEFKLSINGRVKIFTFFNLEVVAGPQKGAKSPDPIAFVYQVDDDSLAEAHGFVLGQQDGAPRIQIWKRVKDQVAATGPVWPLP